MNGRFDNVWRYYKLNHRLRYWTRTTMQKLGFIILLIVSQIATVAAEDWQGEGEVGYVRASGNTESESLNVGLGFLKKSEKWSNKFGISVYQSSNDGIESADSLEAAYTLKRFLGERSNVFLSLSYLDDEFDGFSEQSSVALGYGYKWFDSETLKWETGVGAGYRDADTIPPVGEPDQNFDAQGLSVSGATFVFRSELESQLTDNTRFIWDFKSELGSDNAFYQNDAALQVAMNSRFSLRAQVVIRHNTDPGPDVEETDTISMLSLVYQLNK